MPSTLSGHLNFRVFHDVSKAHTFLKCTKNKHVICCLHPFDDVLPHEKIIRWQIRRRETKFCEHFYDHLPFNCLQVETEEQGFVGKITARSRGLWVKFLGTRQNCVQTCARARFSARVQGLHLVPMPEHRAQLLVRALTKRCVHIGARQAPYPGTMPGHQV